MRTRSANADEVLREYLYAAPEVARGELASQQSDVFSLGLVLYEMGRYDEAMAAFVAEHGYRFLPLYDFDLHTGAWCHKSDCVCLEGFSLEAALECCGPTPTALDAAERAMRYADFMLQAQRLAAELARGDQGPELQLDEELEALRFFSVPQACAAETPDRD